MGVKWHSLTIGIGAFLLLPITITLLSFRTLATTDMAEWALITPTPMATALPDLDARYQAGLSAYAAGEFAQAEAHFREVLTRGGDSAELHHNLAQSLNCVSGFANPETCADAVAIYQQALERNPDLAEAWHGLGMAYEAMGNLGEAERAYGKSAENNHLPALLSLGTLYANAEQFDLAVSTLTAALDLDTDASAARYILGVVYTHQNNWAAARDQWETLIQRDPASEWAEAAQEQLSDD